MSTQELFENPNEKPNKKGKKIYTAEEKKAMVERMKAGKAKKKAERELTKQTKVEKPAKKTVASKIPKEEQITELKKEIREENRSSDVDMNKINMLQEQLQLLNNNMSKLEKYRLEQEENKKLQKMREMEAKRVREEKIQQEAERKEMEELDALFEMGRKEVETPVKTKTPSPPPQRYEYYDSLTGTTKYY